MSELERGEYVAARDWRLDVTRCRECRARIVFHRTGSSRIPLDVSTLRTTDSEREAMRTHFASCPKRAKFGRRKKPAKASAGQRRLF